MDNILEVIAPPTAIIEANRPSVPVGLLSNAEKDRLIERGFLGLYRWYLSRSQATRNWNPDSSFDWKTIRHDLSPDMILLLEGFFAVEQYAPDYTSQILHMVRRSHGRSHFQMRWGSEEEKHADTWENAVLFSRGRTPKYLEQYKSALRAREWTAPWDDALHMLVYTVFQERATQLNYLNLGKIARGQSDRPELNADVDPVLAKVAHTIAIDEAAHYNFFLEGARLFLYYYPEKTLQTILDVINHFSMPAQLVIPNWNEVAEVIYKLGVYGPRQYQRDVLLPVFANLTVEGRRALEAGIKRSREVPTDDGTMRGTAIWSAFNPVQVELDVKRLFDKISTYEATIGFDEIDPTRFIANPEWPTQGFQ